VPFRDRKDAGQRLAKALSRFKGRNPIILALPRGGVPVAAEVASELAAPLDLIMARKIGVPFQPEVAMGAVVDGSHPLIVKNEDVIALAQISKAQFDRVVQDELLEIKRRRHRYLGNKAPLELASRIVILIDDGVATGATTIAALRAIKGQSPHLLILAVPVAPTEVIASLKAEADEVICLEHHRRFSAVGYYYDHFEQVSDDAVCQILAKAEANARVDLGSERMSAHKV